MKRNEIIHQLRCKRYAIVNEDSEYTYLLNMHMHSVSNEAICKLAMDKTKSENILYQITNTSVEHAWISDLKTLRSNYLSHRNSRLNSITNIKKRKRAHHP
jgi:hypothetical protein